MTENLVSGIMKIDSQRSKGFLRILTALLVFAFGFDAAVLGKMPLHGWTARQKPGQGAKKPPCVLYKPLLTDHEKSDCRELDSSHSF